MSRVNSYGSLLALLFFAAIQPAAASERTREIHDFAQNQSTQQWSSVNDSVMGGVSRGRSQISNGRLVFTGNLSLANNGGFASVRSRSKRPDLQDAVALTVRVRGDGRKYFLNLRERSSRMAYSYRASITTKAGEWQEIKVPIAAFAATSFGRTLRNARPVNTGAVESIGFMIADKEAGPFKLEVDWIRAVLQDDSLASSARTSR